MGGNAIKLFAIRVLLLTTFLVFICHTLFAQLPVKNLVAAIDSSTTNSALEKLYIQTDRATYALGDTLWFKAYVLNADDLAGSRKSGLMYIQILDENKKVVRLEMVTIHTGSAWGNIALSDKVYRPGNYTLKAYTNWMLNYDEHYVFSKVFTITDNSPENWLINAGFHPIISGINVDLGLTDLLQKPVGLKDVDVALLQDKRVLKKDKLTTGLDGKLDFDIPKSTNTRDMKIKINSAVAQKATTSYLIPIILNPDESTDLQFMPEGGILIAGLDSKIAFKAIAEDGKGTNVSGYIYDSQHNQVAKFEAAHLGVGIFHLTPKDGEAYTAEIITGEGTSKSYQLPKVSKTGVLLNVTDHFDSDSLTITINATKDIAGLPASYYLVAESRGLSCYGQLLKINEQNTPIKISKAIFPTGIARFTLLDQKYTPISQVPVFIDQNDQLRVNVLTSKPIYSKRDSVTLDVQVTDTKNNPVQGIFSLAITDDGRVQAENNGSLLSYMLLTSDLKGHIEDAGYYFAGKMSSKRHEDLENMILAQGWVAYPWNNLFSQKQPTHKAEKSFIINGQVTNVFNKPMAGLTIDLLSRKPFFVKSIITNKQGTFSFIDIFPPDTASYFIEAKNKRDLPANGGIKIAENPVPVFSPSAEISIPPYLNLDSSHLKVIHNLATYKLEQDKLNGFKQLKEVNISARKVIKNSHNLNGPGEADFTLDEADLEKQPKLTLGQLVKEHVKGLNVWGGGLYRIWSERLHLIIDGTDVTVNRPEGFTPKQIADQYFDYYTSEDLLGIEVMRGPTGKSMNYVHEYEKDPMLAFYNESFLEVTTRAGKGPFYIVTPGTYLYKPIPFDVPKTFYSPKYTFKESVHTPDERTTIFWEPNIITDSKGKATVRFYAADAAGTYTLIMDGSDMGGHFGALRSKLYIK